MYSLSVVVLAILSSLIYRIDATQKVGCFIKRYHNITGEVFIDGPSQLSIKGFYYDGEGPGGVYFNAGKISGP